MNKIRENSIIKGPVRKSKGWMRRDMFILIRENPEGYDRIVEAAKSENMKMSAFIRKLLKEKQIKKEDLNKKIVLMHKKILRGFEGVFRKYRMFFG